jgi:hypothetical protein
LALLVISRQSAFEADIAESSIVPTNDDPDRFGKDYSQPESDA